MAVVGAGLSTGPGPSVVVLVLDTPVKVELDNQK